MIMADTDDLEGKEERDKEGEIEKKIEEEEQTPITPPKGGDKWEKLYAKNKQQTRDFDAFQKIQRDVTVRNQQKITELEAKLNNQSGETKSPDPIEDPEGYAKYLQVENHNLKEEQKRLKNSIKGDIQQEILRDKYNDYDEVMNKALILKGQNSDFSNRLILAKNPYIIAYNYIKKIEENNSLPPKISDIGNGGNNGSYSNDNKGGKIGLDDNDRKNIRIFGWTEKDCLKHKKEMIERNKR